MDAELLGAAIDLVPVYARRERGLLELLPHRLRFQGLDAVRPHEPAGVNEARELVAREERLLQRCVPRHAQVLRVAEDRLDAALGGALLPPARRAALRVLRGARL